jgi:hypothetical protein
VADTGPDQNLHGRRGPLHRPMIDGLAGTCPARGNVGPGGFSGGKSALARRNGLKTRLYRWGAKRTLRRRLFRAEKRATERVLRALELW